MMFWAILTAFALLATFVIVSIVRSVGAEKVVEATEAQAVEVGTAICKQWGHTTEPPVPITNRLTTGFTDRTAFDAWLSGFTNSVVLDAEPVKQGDAPIVNFVTKPDGSIVLK